MKLFKTLILLATVSIALSCSSSENESPLDSKLLVGDWKFDSYDYAVTTKTSFNGDIYESKSEGTAIESDAKVSFSELPNTYSGEGYYLVSLKTEVNGTSYEQVIEVDNFLQEGTWEVSGDKLFVSNSDQQTDELTIVELNSTSLVLHFTKGLNENSNGSNIETMIEGTAYYSRN
ncbi:lipocalin family protein [Algoriphagus sp. D3-2-R+10]|uniref:lipocalin family protein n=1 Tax=Algoriphagus aurantiacus TaxID=3103948 RepID=UPI002B3A4B18|nr:lipocalin family protein [Algoriphagus sp. D3-2-R+10]MEB2778209.1 lipocalin family protein [Algoriphagus sp. D3-2-R+10]